MGRRLTRYLLALSRIRMVNRLVDLTQRSTLVRRLIQSLVRRLERPQWRQVSDGLAEGVWLKVRPTLEAAYIEGHPEKCVVEALEQHLKPGVCFYDIGSHIGFYAIAASKIVGRSGAIYSFEADPTNGERLRMNIKRNEADNIDLVEAAVTGCAREWTSFERLDASRMGGRISTDGINPRAEVLRVRALCLDDFVNEGYRPPDLIKIDVEGAELDVLHGSKKILQQWSPRIICELHSAELASEVTTLLDSNQFTYKWLDSNTSYPCHLIAEPTNE